MVAAGLPAERSLSIDSGPIFQRPAARIVVKGGA